MAGGIRLLITCWMAYHKEKRDTLIFKRYAGRTQMSPSHPMTNVRPVLRSIRNVLLAVTCLLVRFDCNLALVNAAVLAPKARSPDVTESSERSLSSSLEERRDWWSLKPIETSQVPVVVDDTWSEHPIDRFVLSRLEAEGISPVAPAGSRALIRRLSLVLTGLPPTPGQVEQFLQDAEEDPTSAYRHLVTSLLSSPHFGERWARYWMDVVRFAETYGYEWNFEIRDAWRYRDYLIRAFNADVPYDQLVREHIAGDLLGEPRLNLELGINESVIGTAFFRFSETGHDDGVMFPAIRFDPLDNQIDTLSKAFQAMTVSCARCHDHKLDAISTVDYYALVGILESSRQVIHTLDFADRFRQPAEMLRKMKNEIRREISRVWLANLSQLEQNLLLALAPQESIEQNVTKEASPHKEMGTVLKQQMDDQDLPWENPTFVLRQIARLSAADSPGISATWERIRKEYQRQQSEIEEFNSENFEPWGDFRHTDNPGWQVSGLGLAKNRPSPAGEFAVAMNGDQIISRVLPAGQYTHLVSDKLDGTIRSPWLPKQHKYVTVRFLAGGLSMVRAVLDSCILGEFAGGDPTYFAETTEQSKRFATSQDSPHRYYLEMATKSLNPRWPERDGHEKKMNAALRQSPRSWFGIVNAVSHDCPESPKEEVAHVARLFAISDVQTVSNVAQAYRFVIQQAVEAFRDQKATDADVRWINWALTTSLLANHATGDLRLAKSVREYRDLEATISPPRVVVGMADQGPGFDFPVLRGGDPMVTGPLAPRGYLQVLSGTQQKRFGTASESGRLELANRIANPSNPLTARVMVNRIWQQLFGTGIVKTPDNFGRMGELPSHPKLLDFLASEFVEQGYSVKQLIRQIVTSRTFQQASVPHPESERQDADNRLLHHYPVYRLDAEAIRDSMLAVSGRLDRSYFGPSIPPYRFEEKLHRKLRSGPLDSHGRRSIYIKVTRMEGDKFLELFDLPDPMGTRGKRDRTNVPAQALALLNDPFVVSQAQFWAGMLIQRNDLSAADRIRWMYRKALGRPPSTTELQSMSGLVEHLAELHDVQWEEVLDSQQVWKDVCHVLFNVKELIYLW